MRNAVKLWLIPTILLFSCRTERVPVDPANVTFDFGMVEKGIEWLDLINAGAGDDAIRSYFFTEVAPTHGSRSIIHHWERFMVWNDQEFFSFIMQALGRIPSDRPTQSEDGSLTMFGRRQELWEKALEDTDRLRDDLAVLQKTDFGPSVKRAKKFLPEEAEIKANFYFVLFGHSNAYSVGEENGFDLLQLPRKSDGNLDLDEIMRIFAHELHHTGFDFCRSTLMPVVEDPEKILLLGILAAEGMPTHFIDRASLQERTEAQEHGSSLSPEIRDWLRHSARIKDLYLEAERDLLSNLNGTLKQDDVMEAWMSGAKGAAYVLGADMISVIEEVLGVDRAVSVAGDYRNFLMTYNSAARRGIQQGMDLFVFDEDLARRLSEYK